MEFNYKNSVGITAKVVPIDKKKWKCVFSDGSEAEMESVSSILNRLRESGFYPYDRDRYRIMGYDPRYESKRKETCYGTFAYMDECVRYLNQLKTGTLGDTIKFRMEEI